MQKILIVDDSEINREILAAMLEKTYEIDMAKDGQEAIEILEKKWETYQIVLLDLNMPVMNGYEVLKVMEEKQWLDSLPVICISAETSEASIGKAYELGATDYFTRPFDTAVVLRCVQNTIALYAKASSSLHDAMEMLSGIFYRIIKINLSTDTYRTLKNISDDFRSPLDGIKSISQRLMQYGEEYVHEEDQEAFLEFCDSENLRKNFSEEDTERISMSYRCRNGQEFRWVSMEIIKSTEYAKDNEVVVLYLRDINTDYLKQLDMVQHFDSTGGWAQKFYRKFQQKAYDGFFRKRSHGHSGKLSGIQHRKPSSAALLRNSRDGSQCFFRSDRGYSLFYQYYGEVSGRKDAADPVSEKL